MSSRKLPEGWTLRKSKTRVGLKYYYNTKTGEKYWRDKVLPGLWALDRTGSEKTYVNLQTGAREVNLANVFATAAAQPPVYEMHQPEPERARDKSNTKSSSGRPNRKRPEQKEIVTEPRINPSSRHSMPSARRESSRYPPPEQQQLPAQPPAPQRPPPRKSRRSPSRRSPSRRSPSRRSPRRKSPTRRSPSRRSPRRKSPSRRSSEKRNRSRSRSRDRRRTRTADKGRPSSSSKRSRSSRFDQGPLEPPPPEPPQQHASKHLPSHSSMSSTRSRPSRFDQPPSRKPQSDQPPPLPPQQPPPLPPSQPPLPSQQPPLPSQQPPLPSQPSSQPPLPPATPEPARRDQDYSASGSSRDSDSQDKLDVSTYQMIKSLGLSDRAVERKIRGDAEFYGATSSEVDRVMRKVFG